MGVSISSGQLSNLLTKQNADFQKEKDSLLTAGLQSSDYIQVDDTGARHQGKNGFCTQIGIQAFTFFKTSKNKSKDNFLTILQGKQTGYLLNQVAYDYLKRLKSFSNWSLSRVEFHLDKDVVYHSKNEWLNYLQLSPLYQRLLQSAHRSCHARLFRTRYF